jgi:hypothetical protein
VWGGWHYTLPHHRQNAAVLLSRTYVFAAFGGRWPGVVFLISALSGKLALGPIASRTRHNCSKSGFSVHNYTSIGEVWFWVPKKDDQIEI